MVRLISLLSLVGLSLATAIPATQEAQLSNAIAAFNDAEAARLAAKVDPTTKAERAIKRKCDKQCATTASACTAACMANLLALNVGNLAPCFAACGTASATCHNVCTKAEVELAEEDLAALTEAATVPVVTGA